MAENKTTDLLWSALDCFINDHEDYKHEAARRSEPTTRYEAAIRDAKAAVNKIEAQDIPEPARPLLWSIDPLEAVRTVAKLAALLGAREEWSYELFDDIRDTLTEVLPTAIDTDDGKTRAQWMRTENALYPSVYAVWDEEEIAEAEEA